MPAAAAANETERHAREREPAANRSPLRRLPGALRRAGLGDLVLLLYVVTFVRQYFWPVEANALAWTLTLFASALLWALHLTSKETTEERTPLQFWLVVALPLFVIFGMRAAIPDTSFDVLNYRLVNAERGLAGWPFKPGDFFPAFYPLNPAPDMLLGLLRHLLGYRLGTVTNYLVLLWAGTILDRLLRPYIADKWLRSAGVLLVLWTEHALFLINNYMVDLLALPLLLGATLIALRAGERGSTTRGEAVRLGLLLGASVALKLLNLAFVIPVVLIYACTALAARRMRLNRETATNALLAAVAFALPLAPFTLYIYRETGSPVFPFFNKIFKSPYWPLSTLADPRWGPKTAAEALVWPLRVAFRADRIGELAVYSGRVSLVFVAALLCLVFARRDRNLRALSVATLAGALLWGATLTGYARYSVFVEFMGGAMLLGFVSSLRLSAKTAARGGRVIRWALAALLFSALLAQCRLAATYVARQEWSLRPTVFEKYDVYVEESRYLLRDYRLEKFLRPPERRLTEVGAWVECGLLASGVESLFNSDAPILCAYVPDYFYTTEGREKFSRALAAADGKEVGALCIESQMVGCRDALARWHLEIVETVPVKVPVYSRRTTLKMVLMIVRLPGEIRTGNR
jgi:hypothetical protein